MSDSFAASDTRRKLGQYEIPLEARWATWFSGVSRTRESDGTVIRGSVIDQAALHVLSKVDRRREVRDEFLATLVMSSTPTCATRSDCSTSKSKSIRPTSTSSRPAEPRPRRLTKSPAYCRSSQASATQPRTSNGPPGARQKSTADYPPKRTARDPYTRAASGE